MSALTQSWLQRENEFAAFTTGPLLDFWQQRQEDVFMGVDDVSIRFVRFTSEQHTRVILISPGRIESYMKYPELAYDLFHSGYDVVIVDHRGQGKSGRMLEDHHRGHVVRFDDYVDDLEILWQQEILSKPYQRRFALAHSMGGAIMALFLARKPQGVDAAALCSPMTGIKLPMPLWLAKRITDWAERYPTMRDNYALGTGHWRPLPFIVNELTHSRVRYRRFLRYYADYPELQVGGPTYHWVRESIQESGLSRWRRILLRRCCCYKPVAIGSSQMHHILLFVRHSRKREIHLTAVFPTSFKAHAMRSCLSGTYSALKR